MGGKINETVKMVNNCKFHIIVRNYKGVTDIGLWVKMHKICSNPENSTLTLREACLDLWKIGVFTLAYLVCLHIANK